jgi:hypothetical protein
MVVKPDVWSFWFFVLLFSLILVFAVYTTIFAFIKLGKPGISEEVRSLVLKRHVAAIILYTVCNLYIPATAIMVLAHPEYNAGVPGYKNWKVFLKILYFS